MTTLTELVRILEEDQSPDGWPSIQMRDVSNLASTIEALQRENADLETRWAEWKDSLNSVMEQRNALQAEVDRLKSERDRNLDSIRVNNEIINKKNAELAALKGAEPVAWMDDFGNAFPLGANKGAGSWMDAHKRTWKPLYAGAAPQAPAPEPVGFMSPKQLHAIRDPEDKSGHYIPMRKTAAGLFTMALYAAPQAPAPLTEAQRKDLWHGTHEAHSTWSSYSWFCHGIRSAEKAHGITEAQG